MAAINSTTEEMDNFERTMEPQKTVKSMQWALNKFVKWQKSSGNKVNLKTSDPTNIAEALRGFYFSLKKDNIQLYHAVTLRGIKAGLHRYITHAPNPRSSMIEYQDKQFTVAKIGENWAYLRFHEKDTYIKNLQY